MAGTRFGTQGRSHAASRAVAHPRSDSDSDERATRLTGCGYRVLRRLGAGSRAEVFLADSLGQDEPVALKVYRDDADRAGIDRELTALDRARHPHVVRLVDVDALEGGTPIAVIERLSRGTLTALLEERAEVTLGECITVLAPIAAALDFLHERGVVHGAVGSGSVMFRSSGAPVLARFGSATLELAGRSDAELARSDGVRADRAALADLARIVLARAGLDDDGIERLVGDSGADNYGGALAERLFAAGAPLPVSFVPSAHAFSPPRMRGTAPAAVAGARGVWAERLLGGVPVLVERASAAGAALRSLRPRYRVIGVLGALVVGILLVSAFGIGSSGPGARSTAPHPAPEEQPSPLAAAEQDPAARDIGGDDPLVALPALLARRSSCIDALSVGCLDAVDQAGSSALAADVALIEGVLAGGELPVAVAVRARDLSIADSLGDSVLVRLPRGTEPASVLVMRTEAGWRIRDYLD
jgi:serine/threonine protein kinase